MKLKFPVSIFFIILLKCVFRCNAQGNSNTATAPISYEFAWKLFQHSKGINKDADNFVLSPLTVQHSLSVLQYTAEGSTKEQIKQVTDNVDSTQLYYILNPAGASPEVKSASGIFIDSNDRVNENASDYIYINGGDIYEIPLQNDSVKAKNIINSWASRATEGHIPQIISPETDVSSLQALLASAIFFHSSWKHQFKPSQSKKFYTLFNEEVQAEYMEVNSYFKINNFNLDYANRASVINLPYKDNRYSMFLIVPSPSTDLQMFLEMLNYKNFSEIISNSSNLPLTKLKLIMPKFKVSSKTSLVSTLKKMGLIDIFSQSQSRLTKLLDGNKALRINEILQQSTLEVDESGTTATSVTTISVVPLSAAEPEPQIFVIERPFLVVIVENANHAPIFIARITNPAIKG